MTRSEVRYLGTPLWFCFCVAILEILPPDPGLLFTPRLIMWTHGNTPPPLVCLDRGPDSLGQVPRSAFVKLGFRFTYADIGAGVRVAPLPLA